MAILVKGPVAIDIDFSFIYSGELIGEFVIRKEHETPDVNLNDKFDIIVNLSDVPENDSILEKCILNSWYKTSSGITYRFKAQKMRLIKNENICSERTNSN